LARASGKEGLYSENFTSLPAIGAHGGNQFVRWGKVGGGNVVGRQMIWGPVLVK